MCNKKAAHSGSLLVVHGGRYADRVWSDLEAMHHGVEFPGQPGECGGALVHLGAIVRHGSGGILDLADILGDLRGYHRPLGDILADFGLVHSVEIVDDSARIVAGERDYFVTFAAMDPVMAFTEDSP